MESKKEQELIEKGKKGLLALAELEISRLEESNQQLITMFDEDESALPIIDRDFHDIMGHRYDAIVKIYGDFDNNLQIFEDFKERYRKAKMERVTLLFIYRNRRINLRRWNND